MPKMSKLFQDRRPSVIRMAQIRFDERRDGTEAINVAIGNIQLPMYPAMIDRMFHLDREDSPFKDGVVKYSATSGVPECIEAFRNVIASSGFDVSNVVGHITEGGTQAMELLVCGICGPGGSGEKPLLLIDAAYTNYKTLCQRLDRSTCSITRLLGDDGKFSLPAIEDIEKTIEENDPGAILVIPFDNPTGQYYDKTTLMELAKLAVKYDLWLVSDEAYRELYYTGDGTEPCTSIWGITDADVPGIEGRRISVETTSKVWNACGLRIGALMTDNAEFNRQAIAEHTVSLCSSVIGMHIFGAVAHEDHETLQAWYRKQRDYYREMLFSFTRGMREALPGVVVSSPDAALYSVIDVKNLVDENFSALDFVMWCASEGSIEKDGRKLTVLTAPMAGFYNVAPGEPNPGRTQMRVAYVAQPAEMTQIPEAFSALLRKYLDR